MADIKITSTPAPGAKPSTGAPAAAPIAIKPVTPAAATGPAVSAKPAPATGATPAPAVTPAGAFQNIFSKTSQAASGSKMIESIVAGKSTAASKLKPILGSAPQLQKTLEQEREYRQKKALKNWQIIFAVVLLFGLGSAGYFFSELSPSFTLFGQNTTVKLGLINENLRSLQTKINKSRYLMAQTNLNTFSYVAEQYLDTSEKLSDSNITESDKAVLAAKLSELEIQIPTILEDIRRALLTDIVYKTVPLEGQPVLTDEEIRAQYETDLRTALAQEKAALLSATTNLSQEDRDNIRLIDNALKLVGNKALMATIKGLTIDDLKKNLEEYKTSYDPIIRRKIQTTFKNILSSTSSDIAVIASLKAARINWSSLINQIAEVTNGVDHNFDVKTFRNDLILAAGGINYMSLDFDAPANKISVTGTTFTTDGRNFSLISDLIDAFESSPYFKDVEMRSFSKSNDEKGYSSNFNFSLGLENPNEAQNDTAVTVSLGRDTLRERTGIRRIKN